ncbi:T9SS type A sorting domain-containing protein [Kaistella sp. DKR-2]|uniref:T9SS type A sorting domain-containing protein n=1 Tax=Kaistella soli TaxID=2849654 RepID=UPI001C27396D|nr:T9SS type A sorting domain-containing protein [Kaistella soli]MBU8883968.1 T9SS type A sorting domain-containing protein [Kaistella soli]
MRKFSLLFLFLGLNLFSSQKILFDNTKAEMAGNADWVIDSDGGTAQRTPTPAQSGITSSTSETYWKGALSAWGVDLVKTNPNYILETLPASGKITYGDSTNPQDLSNYKVYIVDEPNTKFTVAESNAIVNFVKNGGGLFMISDHTISDRNNDGWDSPAIWNDLMSNNTVLSNPFGITFDLKNLSGTYTNIANLPTNPVLHGTAGNPSMIMLSNGTSMTLNTAKNSSVQGLMFTTGTFGTTNALVSTATYGTGKVVALGDSSIPDDGTGNSGNTLYNGYTGDANGNHKPLLLNAVMWLASASNLSLADVSAAELSAYPNPSSDFLNFKGSSVKNTEYVIVDASGRTVAKSVTNGNQVDIRNLTNGVYTLMLSVDGQTKSVRFIKN